MPLRQLELRRVLRAAMILWMLALANSVHAQVTTGTVRGVVKDQTGAVIPGATVTITDPNTKTSQTAQSGSGGEYQFNNLLVGTYQITVQPPADSNFATLTLSDVHVKLNEVTDVPTVMQPGQATASVTVSVGGDSSWLMQPRSTCRKISARVRLWIWRKQQMWLA